MNIGRLCLAVLLVLLAPLHALAACNKSQPGWLWNYNGELAGKYRIRMTLVFAGESLSGV